MEVVEAAASSRAICRECASAIREGEPRFGVIQTTQEGQRTRWYHFACAAQAMPRALRQALDLEAWAPVPEADRAELRELIERALTRPVREDSALVEFRSGRTSSAMAAAAVLEPAHGADELEPERAQAWVVADGLQTRGDPRGELLALELAAEHTDDHEAARTLQQAHHRCRHRHLQGPEASKQLRLRWIGGFLRGAFALDRAQLAAVLADEAARTLERLRLDFSPQDELEQLVALALEHGVELDALELRHARYRDLGPLAKLERLRRLRVGDRLYADDLAALPQLHGLSLRGRVRFGRRGLPIVPGLEVLELRELQRSGPALLEGLGQLRSLRTLTIHGPLEPEASGVLATALRDASTLEALVVPELELRDLSWLPSQTKLHTLELAPANLNALDQLAVLTELERLALRGSKVGELGALRALEHCRHLALIGTRTTGLARLRRMPRLRSLALEGGDMNRITGLDTLPELEQLSLTRVANLDLDQLTSLEQLDTLVLRPGGARPWQLDRLGTLPKLRRLSAPLELLERAKPRERARALAQIEVAELDGAGLPSAGLLRALPRLRRLILRDRDPVELARFADANPELAVFGELPPRDVLDRVDPFDWRTLGWVPRSLATQ